MLPYYLLLILPLVAGLVTQFTNFKTKTSRNMLLTFFGVLFVLLSLRHISVGNDVLRYEFFFRHISKMPWSEFTHVDGLEHELGYVFLNKCISLVIGNFQMFLAVMAFLTLVPLYYVYRKKLVNSFLTIVLFVNMSTFVMLFSGVRQALAISIGVLAFQAIEKRKNIVALLLIIIAITVHTSAFILILLYPIYYIRISKRVACAAIPVMLGIFALRKPILVHLLPIMPEKYARHFSIVDTGAYTMLFLLVLFLVFAYIIPDDELDCRDIRVLRNMLLVAIGIQMFASINNLVMRFNYYFIIFLPIFIPQIIKCTSIKWKQFAKLAEAVLIFFFMIYFIYTMYRGTGTLDVFPYHFFWEVLE